MKRFLQSGIFTALVGMALYVGVTAALWPEMKVELPPEEPKSAPVRRLVPVVKAPSWEFASPELDQLVQELQKEREALAERSRQLDELAARLQSERNELNVVTQAVHQLQRQLDDSVIRIAEEEAANLKKLAKVYAAMSPDGAAVILTRLDETTVVKIMALMRESETAPILETIAKMGDAESKLAASISERLRLAVFRKTAVKSKT